MKIIYTHAGHEILVDDDVYAWLGGYTWRVGLHGYVYTANKNRSKLGPTYPRDVKLHRLVFGIAEMTPENRVIEIDHIDHNLLNNQRSNLRACLHVQNSKNRKLGSNNTSGFKGVHWAARHKSWVARIQANGRRHLLGYFKSAEEAYAAYCEAVERHHGRFGHIP